VEERLGPVFETHVRDWDVHLERMIDFWSSALLCTGRYSGQPVERHREIGGLDAEHFDRWLALFEKTVRDLCPPREAQAFIVRARRMRQGIAKVLELDDGSGVRIPRDPSVGLTGIDSGTRAPDCVANRTQDIPEGRTRNMETAGNPIIVTTGVCRHCNSVHTARVYHRDYPEVCAEGDTPVQAAVGLIEQLSRTLDYVSDRWRREPVLTAIADVRAFLNRDEHEA
jgi:truncated hemoglobin YjbI